MNAGASNHVDTALAAAQACEDVARGLLSGSDHACDLAMLFYTRHHVDHLRDALAEVRSALNPRTVIGVSAEAVIARAQEMENLAGFAVLGARLPGVRLRPFTSETLVPVDESESGVAQVADTIGSDDRLRFTFLAADPFSVPLVKLVPAINTARKLSGARSSVLMGGLASAGRGPGQNALVIDDQILTSGAVGVSLSGALRVDTIVSQGCRPFGPNLVVTKARGNVILQLGGRPAMRAIQEAIDELPESVREQLKRGLFIGRVIDEYKDRWGRSDYLIRGVIGVDQASSAVAVSDLVRTGQTIRLHVRDATTASEDLNLLLDAQKLHDRPAGALLVTCNGRGSKLFSEPHHDARAIAKAFALPRPGEDLAKGGTPIDPTLATPGAASVPLAGFFASGEIGPVGEESFLHGHTACLALFRAAE
jgi:small ligand-binding sensory domain FIST